MNVGTKSILFGYHQFVLHPLLVALAWWIIYGFPWNWRLWVTFFLHDLGYLGKPNMDGPEGRAHPDVAARIAHKVFGPGWADFIRYHSRWCANRDRKAISALAVADKYAYCLYPPRLCVFLARLSGEVHEYVAIDEVELGSRVSTVEWNERLRKKLSRWRNKKQQVGCYVNKRF